MTPAERDFSQFLREVKPTSDSNLAEPPIAEPLRRRVLMTARRHCRQHPFATALGILGVAGLIGEGAIPALPVPFAHLPTMVFFPALLILALLTGGRAVWAFTVGAVLLEAVTLPPTWSIMIDPAYMPFFIAFAIALTISAAVISFIGGERMRFRWLVRFRDPAKFRSRAAHRWTLRESDSPLTG